MLYGILSLGTCKVGRILKVVLEAHEKNINKVDDFDVYYIKKKILFTALILERTGFRSSRYNRDYIYISFNISCII